MKQTIESYLSDWMAESIRATFPEADLDGLPLGVVATADDQFGDYQCNAAMGLAKRLKSKPRDIAQTIVDRVTPAEGVIRLDIAGPGFINIFLQNDWLAGQLSGLVLEGGLELPQPGAGQTVVIDYASPNVAKPMHIGHIRSTVIGNALDRMYRALGYTVYSDNHIGDWGTQFGLILLGYKTFRDEEALKANAVEELERIYVESQRRSKEDEAWREEAKKELVKLQQGDEENFALWTAFKEQSLKEFDKIFGRLGVQFDMVRGESHYNDRLKGIVDLLQEKGLATESDGAQIVDLEEDKLPVCIVQKSDGGFNYATSDIATVQTRIEEFKPDRIVYVTDERQQLHFNQFFKICEKLGWTVPLKHVWFGLMRMPDAVISTREGNVIKLEKMLDDAESHALELVQERSPDMPEAQQREVARAVGIGALKYADLSQNMQSIITFTWEKALSMEGNSAPYLQYAYARIASVGDKYREQFPAGNLGAHPMVLAEPIERKIAVHLLRFPEALKNAVANYRPNFLADYLFELSQLYSTYYQNVPFLKADEGVRESRVRIGQSVACVLREGLALLGIDTPDRI